MDICIKIRPFLIIVAVVSLLIFSSACLFADSQVIFIEPNKIFPQKDIEIKNYKKIAEYWFYLGYYLGAAGLYDDAIEAYTRAISTYPDFAAAYSNRGVAYSWKGLEELAIEDYNKGECLPKDRQENLLILYKNFRRSQITPEFERCVNHFLFF